MDKAIFNSEEFDWSTVNVVLLGKNIAGLLAIKYKKSQTKELRYARGNKPVGFKRGNKKYEGEISILKSELEALKDAAPKGDILDLRGFDIVFSYVGDDGVMKTDICKICEFTESEEAMKQGDQNGEYALPFICLDIVPA
jgi:hypothetical protein